MRMKWVCYYLLVLTMQIMTWGSATSRHLAPNHHDHGPQKQDKGSILDSFHIKINSDQGLEGIEGRKEKSKGSSIKLQKKIGSTPPNCENKCYGCSPCEAIQVPTDTSRFSIQHANYFPEGWKCKCGTSFYGP